MTPERIEEIKRNFKVGSPWWFMIKKADIAYLIHSLEESQQQNARWKEAVNGLMMADRCSEGFSGGTADHIPAKGGVG